jgi:hypothetical protein
MFEVQRLFDDESCRSRGEPATWQMIWMFNPLSTASRTCDVIAGKVEDVALLCQKSFLPAAAVRIATAVTSLLREPHRNMIQVSRLRA